MDVVVIFNGLGNQMSQYAFYMSKLKHSKGCRFIFDPFSNTEHNGSELDKLFGIKYIDNILHRFLVWVFKYKKRPKIWRLLNLLGVRIIKEPLNYDFNSCYLNKGPWGINFYIGGWHSEKYFSDIKSLVIDTFSFPVSKIKDFECQQIVEKIKFSSNSVSLHVRRGDFLNIDKNNPYQLGGVATDQYYINAINHINSIIPNATFFCFSNDIEWCRGTFLNIDIVFVDCNNGINSWRDMYLMSLCKYHINANSTFSWWGAWLSGLNDGFTIVPNKFLLNVETKDIYPENWVQISNN